MNKSDLRIKELCKAKGITQAQLADRLGIKAVSFSQAVQRNSFDIPYLKRIANALGVELVELFADTPYKCPHCGMPLNVKIE